MPNPTPARDIAAERIELIRCVSQLLRANGNRMAESGFSLHRTEANRQADALDLAADAIEAANEHHESEAKMKGTGPITIEDMNANFAAYAKFKASLTAFRRPETPMDDGLFMHERRVFDKVQDAMGQTAPAEPITITLTEKEAVAIKIAFNTLIEYRRKGPPRG